MPDEKEKSVQHFLDLIKKSRRGKFKIYIGMLVKTFDKMNAEKQQHLLKTADNFLATLDA